MYTALLWKHRKYYIENTGGKSTGIQSSSMLLIRKMTKRFSDRSYILFLIC